MDDRFTERERRKLKEGIYCLTGGSVDTVEISRLLGKLDSPLVDNEIWHKMREACRYHYTPNGARGMCTKAVEASTPCDTWQDCPLIEGREQ